MLPAPFNVDDDHTDVPWGSVWCSIGCLAGVTSGIARGIAWILRGDLDLDGFWMSVWEIVKWVFSTLSWVAVLGLLFYFIAFVIFMWTEWIVEMFVTRFGLSGPRMHLLSGIVISSILAITSASHVLDGISSPYQKSTSFSPFKPVPYRSMSESEIRAEIEVDNAFEKLNADWRASEKGRVSPFILPVCVGFSTFSLFGLGILVITVPKSGAVR